MAATEMRFDRKVVKLANRIRKRIQFGTVDIDEGQSVALLAWYTFILDHAECHGLDPKWLAREQIEAFIDGEADNLAIRRGH